MALTVAEYAKIAINEGRTLVPQIINWFLPETYIGQIMPWATDKALAVQVPTVYSLPTVGTRKVGASFSASHGKYDTIVESKYILGHYIDVDVVLAKAGNTIVDMRQHQRKLSAEAMAFNLNNMFLNGDPASDEFKGLLTRIDDVYAAGYTNQYFDAGSVASAGRGVNYDTTERHAMLDNIDKLIDVIVGHRPSAIFMNGKLKLCISSAARHEKLLRYDKDMTGRVMAMYGDSDVPLINIGTTSDLSTEILPNSETLSGGTDETSMVAVRFGEKEYVWGIQQEPLNVTDQGLTHPNYRDVVEWVVGIARGNPMSIARAYGFVADAGA